MPTLLQQLAVDEVTLCRRPAVPHARVAVVKSADASSVTGSDMSKVQQVIAGLRSAFGIQKSYDEQSQVDTALAEVEAALLSEFPVAAHSPEPPDMTPADVAKELSELAAIKKELADGRDAIAKERAELTAELAIAKADRETIAKERAAEAVTKSERDTKAMLGIVSGNVPVLAGLVRKASPEEVEALAQAFTSAATIAKTGAPATRFNGLRVVKSDEAGLESVAKELMEKDAKLTEAQAIVKAATLNPEMYEAQVRAQHAAAAAQGI